MREREREKDRQKESKGGETKRKHNFVNKLYTKVAPPGLGLRNGALGDSLGANMLRKLAA